MSKAQIRKADKIYRDIKKLEIIDKEESEVTYEDNKEGSYCPSDLEELEEPHHKTE